MDSLIEQAWTLRQQGVRDNDLSALCEATKLETQIRKAGGKPILPPIPESSKTCCLEINEGWYVDWSKIKAPKPLVYQRPEGRQGELF